MSIGRRQAGSGFTMVELLVVIAVIAILAAMLLPVLARAKEQSLRAACLSNLRQAGTAVMLYAGNFGDRVPRNHTYGGMDGTCFYCSAAGCGTGYDLRPMVRPYIAGNFRVWTCPYIGAAPLDDPGLTNIAGWGTYFYFPGRAWPDFGRGQPMPDRLSAKFRAAALTLISDQFWDVSRYAWGSPWRFNHGRGQVYKEWATVPMYGVVSGYARRDGYGASLGFYDGHARWTPQGELTIVGSALAPATAPAPVYGVMP